MSGHAYSRALRAHFLTQAALGEVLFKTANCLEGTDADELKTLYEDLIVRNKDPDEVVQDDCVKKVTAVIEHLCDQAAGQGRTVRLWINYFMQVSIIRLFIRAERTGNWWLHVPLCETDASLLSCSGAPCLCQVCSPVHSANDGTSQRDA